MNSTKTGLLKIASLCGACIAFYIGSGFATMQEIMQYNVSYGSRFWLVILVSAVVYLYTNLSFAANGNRLQLRRGGDIYTAYCGRYIGKFFDGFSAFFCYMSFIVMCGGANATMTQQWGLPNGLGAVVLATAVVATAYFGLNSILNALGMLGPVIIVIILTVSTIAGLTGFPHFSAGLEAIDSGAVALVQVGGGSPILSGASYGGFVILWFAAFMAEIGATNRLRDVNSGMLLSSLFIFAATALCCVALIGHLDLVADADIPSLVLAGTVSPVFSAIFAVIIFSGIYTTAVPLLWTGIGAVAKQGSLRYKLLIVAGGALGCGVACFLPYKSLVNILYGLNGYLGFILVAFMIIHDIRRMWSGRKRPAGADGQETAAEPSGKAS